MRRTPALLLALVAVALAAPAGALAALIPVDRTVGELELPRVRSGTIDLGPRPVGAPRVTVLLRLRSAPLAAWGARTTSAAGSSRRLDASSTAARAYLATLALEQERAARALTAAIPEARVERRFAVLLNALAASIPARDVARLASLDLVTRVYPSVRYTLALDRSPGVVGIADLRNATGSRGGGVKIAIVDDGIDRGSPLLRPAGLEPPTGFPRGVRSYTSGKVIVARSFVAPGAGPAARLPFDPESSFHGTHVAGIAAGAADTTAPGGLDRPETAGLSGVAPRAWLGNYRVFNFPTPAGNVANTPEIVAAFEAAVHDGMDVVNFSGGGAETEPANDALVEAVANATRAGVTVVIAAGNERDDFGPGSLASPGTAPDAISVAAVENARVFAPALTVRGDDAPAVLRAVPYAAAGGALPPRRWISSDRRLVDVGTLPGTDGKPVDRSLCGPAGAPNTRRSTLAPGALKGRIALVARGTCTFMTKASIAGREGAIGLVVIDNRSGEASGIGVELDLPVLTIADADGTALVAYLATRGGEAPIRVGREPLAIGTDRAGVVTSFSSTGPTAFDHALKPDVAAPGGQILSAVSRGYAESRFGVLSGTSMATPHVAGAAALLLERHPGWAPWQVKSALVSTAGTAWADSARTVEAPVTLAGGGLLDALAADTPGVHTRPASLSFGDLDTGRGPTGRTLVLEIADAGGGAGTWTIEARAQSAPASASLDLPATVVVPAGGSAAVVVTARGSVDGAAGDAYGHLVLRQGSVERRVPYLFLVTRPGLAALDPVPLTRPRIGTTRGASRVAIYRYPLAPYGPAPDYVGAPLVESGREALYTFLVPRPAINAGVAIDPIDVEARFDAFLLRGPDENSVQGLAGTPVVVNGLLDTYQLPADAAGTSFPLPGRYYAAIDSPRDRFSGRTRPGRFVVRAWIDDLTPPRVRLLTQTLSSRRGLVALRVLDDGAGVDPLSLVVGYGNALVGASAYDPISGLALFPVPKDAPLDQGENAITVVAADRQEGKNLNTLDGALFPNTTLLTPTVRVDPASVTVSWLEPGRDRCVPGEPGRLIVVADGPTPIASVRFLADGRQVGLDRKGARGVFDVRWTPPGKGRAVLAAVATDGSGRSATASLSVRLCG